MDIGYFSLGAGPGMMSRGTAVSLVGAALEPMFAFRDGALRTVRAAERMRSFRVDGRDRTALSIGGAEHLWLPAGRPAAARGERVRRRRRAGRATRLQAASALTAAVTRVPGVRTALRSAPSRSPGCCRLPRRGPRPARGRGSPPWRPTAPAARWRR